MSLPAMTLGAARMVETCLALSASVRAGTSVELGATPALSLDELDRSQAEKLNKLAARIRRALNFMTNLRELDLGLERKTNYRLASLDTVYSSSGSASLPSAFLIPNFSRRYCKVRKVRPSSLADFVML